MDVPLFPLEVVVAPQVEASPDEIAIEGVSAIHLAYRAFELRLTFMALSAANRGSGMQIADQNTHHRAAFQKRYGRRAGNVVVGSGTSENRHIRNARYHFENAAGRQQMLDAGVNPLDVADEMQTMWVAFSSDYGVGRTYAKTRKKVANNIIRIANKVTKSKVPLYK